MLFWRNLIQSHFVVHWFYASLMLYTANERTASVNVYTAVRPVMQTWEETCFYYGIMKDFAETRFMRLISGMLNCATFPSLTDNRIVLVCSGWNKLSLVVAQSGLGW